jgi:hypothetical protein
MTSRFFIPFASHTESSCCSGGKQPKPPKEKKPKKEKPKKSDPKEKEEAKAEAKPEAGKSSSGKDKEKGGKPSPYQVSEIVPTHFCDSLLCCKDNGSSLSCRLRDSQREDNAIFSFTTRVGFLSMSLI